MLVLEERQSLREGSAEMQAHALAGLDTFSGWWGIKNGSRLLTVNRRTAEIPDSGGEIEILELLLAQSVSFPLSTMHV